MNFPICHGENFLSAQPARAEVWNGCIDRMVGKDLFDRPAASYAEGFLSYRAQWLRFNREDRQDLVDYLVKNFGPGAKPRNVRTDPEAPLDEAQLGQAMYMEYYVKDPPGQGVHSAEDMTALGFTGRRVIQDVRSTPRGMCGRAIQARPCRLIKLNPRTGEMKEWLMPHPKSDIHEVLIGRDSTIWIWMPEHAEGGIPSFKRTVSAVGVVPLQRNLDPKCGSMRCSRVDSQLSEPSDIMANHSLRQKARHY